MMKTLCLDFGNTRLKAAVFYGQTLREEIPVKENSREAILSLIDHYNPSKSILSSVINHDPEIENILSNKTQFHKLSDKSKKNFSIPVSKPDTIGPDRLALMAAAVDIYPGKNNLVIGMGSCITYNFVDQRGSFLGGAISPGMDMRFRAMHEFTAKLPLTGADWNFPLIGYNTPTNLQSGVIHGICGEIEGFINRYSEKFGNFNAILTGGNALHFASQLKNRIFADANLLFKGLYVLSEINS
ncbi:MAG: type III pantothenate kinase [Ferruginibacter sp.]|nr:type III pantothenate kinase [Ferruginibacter sp.]